MRTSKKNEESKFIVPMRFKDCEEDISEKIVVYLFILLLLIFLSTWSMDLDMLSCVTYLFSCFVVLGFS